MSFKSQFREIWRDARGYRRPSPNCPSKCALCGKVWRPGKENFIAQFDSSKKDIHYICHNHPGEHWDCFAIKEIIVPPMPRWKFVLREAIDDFRYWTKVLIRFLWFMIRDRLTEFDVWLVVKHLRL